MDVPLLIYTCGLLWAVIVSKNIPWYFSNYYYLLLILNVILLFVTWSKTHLLTKIVVILIILITPQIIFIFFGLIGLTTGLVTDSYKYLSKMARLIIPIIYNVKIEGNPKKDPVIYVSNHFRWGVNSFYFVPLIGEKDDSICFVSYDHGGLAPVYKLNKTIVISRKNEHDNFISMAMTRIKEGKSIFIYPEGKYFVEKNNWRGLGKFGRGAFELAVRAKIPIVPVLINGDNTDGIFITYGSTTIKYCDSIYPEEYNNDTEKLSQETFRVMTETLTKM